jgi:hypothetical protein
MNKNKFTLQLGVLCFLVTSFIACDKDFSTLESDIITSDVATNFDVLRMSETNPEFTDIITYTDVIEPVQTNGLGLNSIGIYDDVAYGRTTTSFVSQLTTSSFISDFGEQVKIDSVVLYLPYFSSIEDIDDDENITYEIDSVFGREPFRLSLFESNYFIRDFDPDAEFDEIQPYFSNMSASTSEMISEASLEGVELTFVDYNEDTGEFDPIDNTIEISEEGYVLTASEENEDGEEEVTSRNQFPGIRVLLDTTFWHNKIISKAGDPVLEGQNTFSEYFRGLYFKVEPINDDGSFIILNTAGQTSNITIYYTRLIANSDEEGATEQSTYTLNFGPNRINFINNEFTTVITDGDDVNGDARLFLKGGEGSIAKFKLFNGTDLDDDDDSMNTFEAWKSDFVETDSEGNFVRAKRIVNEANLVFYVDQNLVDGDEPDRLYLYDVDNKQPLDDYFIDISNSGLPSLSKSTHLGPLQRVDDEPDGDGIKYKFTITEHINNLLLRDSTNVELGLAVSLNVNLEDLVTQRQVQTGDNSDFTVPVSSVISPRGTVLHGSNTEDSAKKVYLEIYYTEPNN